MNEQYLGDSRDFVKYDFLLHLARSLNLSDGVTIIPMLTPPRGRKPHPGYGAGTRDQGLYTLLHSIASSLDLTYGQASQKIVSFFSEQGIPCRFVPDGELRPSYRNEYFSRVPQDTLRDSIVFIDPDTGLQGASRPSDAHLGQAEIEQIFARMSDNSVLVVYQHQHQFRSMHETIRSVRRGLYHGTSIRHFAYIWDGQVALFVTTRWPDRLESIYGEMKQYAGRVGCHHDKADLCADDEAPGDRRDGEQVPGRPPCLCGCGGYPKGKKSRYLPGHDARRAR